MVEQALGNGSDGTYRFEVEKHAPALEAALLPTLAVLPRNELGRFSPPAVRYALHRLFFGQRGWRIDGLDPEGAAWNNSSPSEVAILKRLPAAAAGALTQRLGEQGFDAHEVVVFAATLEHLMHGEAAERLRAAYQVLQLPLQTNVTQAEALQAVDLYMASYVLGLHPATTSRAELVATYADIARIYPAWERLQRFVRETLASEGVGARSSAASVCITELTHAIEAVSHNHGPWQNGECLGLKSHLLAIEEHGTGRVRLADFYGAALNGKWQFQESVPYLRQLGALDESNPSDIRVIIPNYVYGHSNCAGSSDYHSICAVPECQGLLGRIERQAPAASPEEIAALVAALPSTSMPARGTLPDILLLRLKRIAFDHGGRVPIYGRLFAQWMHHAYPRECPYPHLAGSTKPMDVYDWEQTGSDVMVFESEARSRAAVHARRGAPEQHAPWVHHEELLGDAAEAAAARARPPALLALHGVAALATIATVGLGLMRMALLGARLARCTRISKAQKASLSAGGMLVV